MFRNFPLTQIHPHAQQAAEAAEAAGVQKSFGMLEYSYHQSYIIPVSITPFVITIILLP